MERKFNPETGRRIGSTTMDNVYVNAQEFAAGVTVSERHGPPYSPTQDGDVIGTRTVALIPWQMGHHVGMSLSFSEENARVLRDALTAFLGEDGGE